MTDAAEVFEICKRKKMNTPQKFEKYKMIHLARKLFGAHGR